MTTFACAGEMLVATLDVPEVPGSTGLLIVSGGNEIRIGAHRGMALLAARLAARGVAVFRFDRRGIGDSTGENGGFLSSAPDIAAAATAFRSEAGIGRIVGFGNCDAATALALFGAEAGIERLVLANPWVVEDADDLPPVAAIRARYVAKLRDPREWWRMARGGVDFGKLVNGLAKIARKRRERPSNLAETMRAALRSRPATILLAERDNTAIAFRTAWDDADFATRDTASHSFAAPGDAAWLEERIVAVVLETAKTGSPPSRE